MADPETAAVVTLLANDALEAAGEKASQATILLMDAALSIMVTSHPSERARREMAEMLSEYVLITVDAVIAGKAAQ